MVDGISPMQGGGAGGGLMRAPARQAARSGRNAISRSAASIGHAPGPMQPARPRPITRALPQRFLDSDSGEDVSAPGTNPSVDKDGRLKKGKQDVGNGQDQQNTNGQQTEGGQGGEQSQAQPQDVDGLPDPGKLALREGTPKPGAGQAPPKDPQAGLPQSTNPQPHPQSSPVVGPVPRPAGGTGAPDEGPTPGPGATLPDQNRLANNLSKAKADGGSGESGQGGGAPNPAAAMMGGADGGKGPDAAGAAMDALKGNDPATKAAEGMVDKATGGNDVAKGIFRIIKHPLFKLIAPPLAPFVVAGFAILLILMVLSYQYAQLNWIERTAVNVVVRAST